MDIVLDDILEEIHDINMEYIADQAIKFNKYRDFKDEFLADIEMIDDQL